jgi:hypothetical protein
MRKTEGGRIIAGIALVLAGTALVLYGCREQPTEPVGIAKTATGTRHLKLLGDGSTASGTLVANRGGLRCAVAAASGSATTAGACEADMPAGTLVIVSATPPADGGTVTWSGCDHAHTDDPLTCRVVMNAERTVTAAFAPRPTSFLLTVQGGSLGSGTVTSTPAGISCTIGSGSPSSVCSARFPTSATVTLRASGSGGKPLKAWAGGDCEKRGTGGDCTVTMSRTQTVVVSFEAEINEAALGSWAAPITWPHVVIHGALLPNGKVITWGRRTGVPVLWSPAAPGAFTTLGRPSDFFCSGHVFLPNGRLIVSGGHNGSADFGLKKVYIFNHDLNTWSATKKMANGRWYPTTTTLASGKILAISGGDTSGMLNRIPEVREKNGNWRALTGAARDVPYYSMMFQAPNGKVFMAGPEQQTAYLNTSNAGSWTNGPLSNFGDRSYGTAVMFEAGKILLLGGNEANPTNTAEVINLNAGGATWRNLAPMSVARRQVSATILADGKVLVTGGTDAAGFNSPPTTNQVLTPELWDPQTEAWTQLSPMTHHRLYHSVTLLLPDGRLLSTGSGEPAAAGMPDDNTAEIFSPPYLFNGDGTPAIRPVISGAPVSVGYGQTFTVSTTDAGSIAKVHWIRLGSTTHSFDQNQRLVKLSYTVASSTSLSVVAPSSKNQAPPGHYMLFIVNTSGVPSEAKIVLVS